MVVKLIVLCVLISCSECFAQTHEKKARKFLVTYFRYGGPADFGYTDSCTIVLRKLYGFKDKSIAGCIVNNRILIRAAIQNTKSDLIQTIRFGRKWKDEFEDEVDSCKKIYGFK
jgi:hypothetical protein